MRFVIVLIKRTWWRWWCFVKCGAFRGELCKTSWFKLLASCLSGSATREAISRSRAQRSSSRSLTVLQNIIIWVYKLLANKRVHKYSKRPFVHAFEMIDLVNSLQLVADADETKGTLIVVHRRYFTSFQLLSPSLLVQYRFQDVDWSSCPKEWRQNRLKYRLQAACSQAPPRWVPRCRRTRQWRTKNVGCLARSRSATILAGDERPASVRSRASSSSPSTPATTPN